MTADHRHKDRETLSEADQHRERCCLSGRGSGEEACFEDRGLRSAGVGLRRGRVARCCLNGYGVGRGNGVGIAVVVDVDVDVVAVAVGEETLSVGWSWEQETCGHWRGTELVGGVSYGRWME